MTNTENNKRIAKNTAMLYFRLLFSMAISLYTSRVILNALGVEDFGIYNVVGGIVVMFGFLNNAMSASTQRFLTFEMGKGDYNQLNRIFSMSITIHASIAIIVLLLSETVGLWILNTQLTIPADRMNAANWVYQCSIFAFIITILYVPYNATIIAHERMNVFALVSILEVILKLFITILVAWLGFEKLKFYAVLVFCVSLVIGVIYTTYCKLKFDECKFHFFWDKQLFQKMSGFASWNLLGVFAGITYNQGVNLILNVFFGPIINAARGIAYQVLGAVNAFVTNFQVAVNPPLTKSYASGDLKYMYSLIFTASKYSFYLLFMLSLPIILETDFVLALWLKTVPEYTTIFTRLVLIDVLICSLSGSLQTMAQASGNVRLYQLVVSGILLLNLPFSYILLKLGYAPQVTFFVSILASLVALFARLIVLKKIVSFPVKNFITNVLSRVVLVSIIGSIIPYFISIQNIHSLMHFSLVLFISIISVGCSVWLLGINQSERSFLKVAFLKLLSFTNNEDIKFKGNH
jgi:O-antigen/teichoic acid export membrane protein